MSNEDAAIAVQPTSFLDEQGKVLSELPEKATDRDFVIGLYTSMIRARTFDAMSDSISDLLNTFSPTECANYLINSGYASI